MLGDKKQQTIGDASVGVQAAGDVNVSVTNVSHGPTVSEVRDICELVWKSNFPILQAESREIARQNMQEFSTLLEARITAAVEQVEMSRFRDPDVQASINEAVQATARLGNRANPELLCELITERLKSGDEFRDVVLAEAIVVVPKLTPKQIAVLVLLQVLLEIRFADNTLALEALESFAQKIRPLCVPGTGISGGQRSHLDYVGVCGTVSNTFRFDIYGALAGQYSALQCNNSESFKALLIEKAPTYAALVHQYEADRLFTMTIASVGSAVALSRMSAVMSPLEFGSWIF